MVFSLKFGSSLVGKLIDENGDNYNIMQNPFAPNIIRSILKEEVVEKMFSTLSPMSGGTINSMNKKEVKDLLAFLASGGNADHDIYTGKKEN